MDNDVSNENPSATAITAHRNLNDLPEELLLRILTLLPTLDTVQTSLISQKWRSLWSRVPALDFPFELFPPYEPPLDTRQFFAEFIDRVLLSRSSDYPVHTFRLSFIYHRHYRPHVDSWVRSAVSRLRARELHLDFFIHADFHVYNPDEETENHRYDFPFAFLRNGQVETLSLTRCDVTLPVNISAVPLLSIGSMILDEVELRDKMMGDLISCCPNLESLVLQNCWGHHHLNICSKRLKSLVLGYFYDSGLKESILIDCPNLVSITFDCCAFDKFVLQNAASLVEFWLGIVHLIPRAYWFWSRVVKLLEKAPNVKHLGVQNWWHKFLTSEDTFPKSFVLHKLNILELRTGHTQYDLVGMAALLKLCPNLEKLVLHHLHKIDKDESLPEELVDNLVDFSMPSLKQVTMKAYSGTKDAANFLKILMTQGVVLEKIVLIPALIGDYGEVIEKSLPPIILYRNDPEDSWNFYSPGLFSSIDAKL